MSGIRGVIVAIVWVGLGLMSVGAAGDAIYVGTQQGGGGIIYRLDPEAFVRMAPVALGFDELGLGVCGPDDHLYWAERGRHRLIRVSQDGSEVLELHRTLGRTPADAPEGPSFDAAGDLYFTNTGRGGVWRIAGGKPWNEAFQIVRFGPTGVRAAGGTLFLTQGPHAGDLIVAQVSADRVLRVSPEAFCTSPQDWYEKDCTQAEAFVTEGLHAPYGLALNRQGELFVANATAPGEVTRYAPDGRFLGVFATDLGGGAVALAFDSQEDLWVVTADAVYKISPQGEKALVSALPGEGRGIAICRGRGARSIADTTPPTPTAVPWELASGWLLLGFYALGKRRRRGF